MRTRVFLMLLAVALVGPSSQASAAAPYEPNDAPPAATGPLLDGTAYTAALEASGDRDYYFFYVSALQAAPVSYAIENRGGGGEPTEIASRVVDSLGATLGGELLFLGAGQRRETSLELGPGRYLLEVSADGGGQAGAGYLLTPGPAAGTFVEYTAIAGRCGSATAMRDRLASKLRHLEARLQRATSRLRRSRFTPPPQRRSARAARARVMAKLGSTRRSKSRAEARREPWCSIPS